MTETKSCTKCGQSKPLDQFKKDKTRKDGHFPQCKQCVKEDRNKNKGKIQDYMKTYREENKATLSESRKDYYKDHQEEERANRKAYYWEHHEKELATMEKYRRTQGIKPMSENKDCSLYLGVHVTEQAIKPILPNATRMEMHHPKYDYLCSQGYKVDVKSSSIYYYEKKNAYRWMFAINKNMEADYFMCVAYDNSENVNIIKIWMIPGKLINHLGRLSISPGSFEKWKEYEIDPTEANVCVDKITS